MQRIFLLIIMILFQMPAVYGLTLEGGVSYTVESARKEAFEGVKYKIPVSSFKEHLRDRNYSENKAAQVDRKCHFKDRRVEFYSDGCYGVVYKNNRLVGYFYDKSGRLTGIDIHLSLVCPTKTYKYDEKGKLKGVIFEVSADEAFIYESNGKFDSHWIGNECFNENGKVILKRINF